MDTWLIILITVAVIGPHRADRFGGQEGKGKREEAKQEVRDRRLEANRSASQARRTERAPRYQKSSPANVPSATGSRQSYMSGARARSIRTRAN